MLSMNSKAMASNGVALILLLVLTCSIQIKCEISGYLVTNKHGPKSRGTLDYVDISPKSLDIVEKFVASATNLVQTESIEALVNGTFEASELLNPALEVAAEVIDLILSNILDDPTQQEILKKLKSIDNKMDVLQIEIKKLLAEISLGKSFDQIASHVTQLNNVKGKYAKWLSNASNLTEARTKRFLKSCVRNGITDKPNFFYRIFVENDDVRQPRKEVIALGATKKYRKFASSMVAYLLKASLLSGVCTGLQGNTIDIQVTITQHADIYGSYLSRTTKVVISDDLQIKSKFWVNALKDMDDHLAFYYERNHSDFANALHQHLTEKYDYREWLVISYGDYSFNRASTHDCWPTPAEQIYNTTDRSTFFYNAVCRLGRNVILASPSIIRPATLPNEFLQSANSCFKITEDYGNSVQTMSDMPMTARKVIYYMPTITFSPGFNPIIYFAFFDQSGYEIVNNSPLAAAEEMAFNRWGYGAPIMYFYVGVLIA